MRTPALYHLLGAYFHQDWFDEFSDEDAAIDAFARDEPEMVGQLQSEVEDLLRRMDERELEAYLDSIGCEYLPGPEVGYRGWIGEIAGHLRAATT